MNKNKLSIVIPIYNEENCIGKLLERIRTIDLGAVGYEKEIICVDDGSTDRSKKIIKAFKDVICIFHDKNLGKGAAVRTGVMRATGNWILIQDGDLEYNPDDYFKLIETAENKRIAVYGSRILGQIKSVNKNQLFPGKNPNQRVSHWLAGMFLSILTLLLYGKWISDVLTAYKLYPGEVLKTISIRTNGFETDHELTAKLIKMGIPITEVPIEYFPRTIEEGKKIKPIDGLIAIWTLIKFRFVE